MCINFTVVSQCKDWWGGGGGPYRVLWGCEPGGVNRSATTLETAENGRPCADGRKTHVNGFQTAPPGSPGALDIGPPSPPIFGKSCNGTRESELWAPGCPPNTAPSFLAILINVQNSGVYETLKYTKSRVACNNRKLIINLAFLNQMKEAKICCCFYITLLLQVYQ